MDFSSFNANTAKYDGNNAYWLGRAAALAYRDEAQIRAETAAWGLGQCRFFDRRETQAFMAANADAVIVAFRGTQPAELKDWMTDSEVLLVDGPFGLVHDGFRRGLDYVWQDIVDALAEFKGKGKSLWFTGHSLGAALATLAVARLRAPPYDQPVYGLYDFGSPRVGDNTFVQNFNADFKPRCFRFVNNADVVTRVPLRTMGYGHVGTFMYFDKDGNLHDDPAFWYKFLDSVEGSIDGLSRLEPAALAAHSMERYVGYLERNIGADPF